MTPTYKYLHFVTLQSLVNWSVAHLLNSDIGFTKHYPFVKIGDVIRRNTTLVSIEDKTLYKQITLKTNGGGTVLRDKKWGKDIGTKKQYLAKEGQFIMSKIDARNGAFGVVSNELDNAIVTGDFPLFDVDTKRINPVYLYLLSATKPFVQYAQSCSRGTTNRQRIDIDAFLSLQIPLPSLEEQNKIVATYNSTIAQADNSSQQAVKINDQIEVYLQNTLGIESSSQQKHESGKIYFMHSSQITRWDVWNVVTSIYSGKYPLALLQNIIKMQSGKFLPSKEQKGGEYNVYGGNGLTGTHNQYCFSGKRIVIGRVGEYCGNVHLIEGDYWITDNALKVDKTTEDVTWEYLTIALKSLNINQYRSISAQPSISQTKILQQQIPVPPLAIQNEIVDYILALRAEQKNLRQQASDLRTQATQQFEQTIFE